MNDTKAAIKRKMDQPFRMPSTEVLGVHHSMLDADLVEQARSRGMRILAGRPTSPTCNGACWQRVRTRWSPTSQRP